MNPCIFAILFAASLSGQIIDSSPRGFSAVLFANLGTPADGTIVYCSDCTAANPTAGGGSGVVVKRENGTWNGTGGVCPLTPFSALFSGASTSSGSLGCGLTYASAVHADFTATAPTQSIKLATAPSLFSVSGVRIEETTTLVSGSGTVTAVQACVGTLAAPCVFSPGGLTLFGTTGQFATFPGPFSAAATATATQDIYLTLTVTNLTPGNLSTMTGATGTVTARVVGGVWQ